MIQTLLKRGVDDQQVHRELFAILSERQRPNKLSRDSSHLSQNDFHPGRKQTNAGEDTGRQNFMQVLWESKLIQPQCSDGESLKP